VSKEIYGVGYTAYGIQRTVYSVQYTVYGIQCTVYGMIGERERQALNDGIDSLYKKGE
jgi:hypothetical protein